MKYLCLIYNEEQKVAAMAEEELAAITAQCVDYDEELKRGGHLVACERLESVTSATTLRVRNGKVAMTDGPFAETKEQLAGFYLVEARDLNEAIRLASKIPPGRLGSVEVRPVMDYRNTGAGRTGSRAFVPV